MRGYVDLICVLCVIVFWGEHDVDSMFSRCVGAVWVLGCIVLSDRMWAKEREQLGKDRRLRRMFHIADLPMALSVGFAACVFAVLNPYWPVESRWAVVIGAFTGGIYEFLVALSRFIEVRWPDRVKS